MAEFDVRPVSLADTRGLRREVLRPHQRLEELAGHEPAGAVAFGAFEGRELVAVGLVGPDGAPGDWRVRGMATAPRARGQGAGGEILQALVQHATEHGASRLWCNARTPARTFYERAGFVVASDEFEPPHTGPHYRMELSVPDAGRVLPVSRRSPVPSRPRRGPLGTKLRIVRSFVPTAPRRPPSRPARPTPAASG